MNIPDKNIIAKELEKFDKINSLPFEKWDELCYQCGDCAICRMAIHMQSTVGMKYLCVYGMSKEFFKSLLIKEENK